MNKLKIIGVLLLTTLLTGCTTVLKDKEGKVVQYTEKTVCETCSKNCETAFEEFEETEEETKESKINACKEECNNTCVQAKTTQTGQNLTENILCKPTDKNMIELYENNNVDLSKLPDCTSLGISSGKYEGIWTTIFVKPLAWLIVLIGNLFKNYGLAVIILTILIRLALYPVTKKTAMQSELMKQAQPELKKLERKYENKNDQQSQMAKSQEMMAIYKKYNINLASGCVFSIIQIPIFFAFYEALNRLPLILEGKFLGFRMGLSPLQGIKTGNYLYVIFIILVIVVTYFSFKLNQTAAGGSEQQKQMQTMMKFIIVMIGIASLSISVAIALYWITNSGFTVAQNLLVKRGRKNENIIKR